MKNYIKALLLICFIIGVSFSVFAENFYTQEEFSAFVTQEPEIISRAAVLMDAETGAILYAKNPHDEIPPASLTKLMTMHLLMNEIEAGRASYDEIIPITVASWAQSQPPRSSLMFLEPRQIVTLREIMLGLSVSSGNDAAVAAALRLAPTMQDFAELMNAEARRMGLTVTTFVEASGISWRNVTTAYEFAQFCRQYIKLHPQTLKDFHSVQVFSYPVAGNLPPSYRNNPRTITQNNNNRLLETFPGVDGLKTGFIEQSGFNIALTAQREQYGENTRFIAVLLGAPSYRGGDRVRDADGRRLLTWAFENFKTVHPVVNRIDNAKLWKGKGSSVELMLQESPAFSSPVNRGFTVNYDVFIPFPLVAPISKGSPAGYLVFYDQHGEISRSLLVAAKDYQKGNIFKRIWHSIVLLFKRY